MTSLQSWKIEKERMACEAIADGRDKPIEWIIAHDTGEDGCMPSGWYAQGLDNTGLPIVWPVRHEYGPFRTESAAREYVKSKGAL